MSACLCCSGWFNVLSRVHSASPEQLLQMQHEQANPKNAVVSVRTNLTLSAPLCVIEYVIFMIFHPQGTLDVGLIDSVCASDNPDR